LSVPFECCVCCQVEVSATGRSLVQRSPTDCGVSLCVIYLRTSRMRRPWPMLGCCARKRSAKCGGRLTPSVKRERERDSPVYIGRWVGLKASLKWFKCQDMLKILTILTVEDGPDRQSRNVCFKPRYVIIQKKDEFSSTAAKAYDLWLFGTLP
jgi:hypothetical protein